jgi:hypothetical protein
MPYFNGADLYKADMGVKERAVQRYWCIDCNRRLIDWADMPTHRMQKLIGQVE